MVHVAKQRLIVASAIALVLSLVGSVSAQGRQLSDEALLGKASDAVGNMKDTLEIALVRLADARKGKDIIQLNCVNEKLSAINGLVKISEQAEKALKEAVAKRDAELKQHEYSKVMLAEKRVSELRLEVEGCVGELSRYTGNTEVVVTTDDDVRSDDSDVAPYQPAFEALNSDRPPAVTGSE